MPSNDVTEQPFAACPGCQFALPCYFRCNSCQLIVGIMLDDAFFHRHQLITAGAVEPGGNIPIIDCHWRLHFVAVIPRSGGYCVPNQCGVNASNFVKCGLGGFSLNSQLLLIVQMLKITAPALAKPRTFGFFAYSRFDYLFNQATAIILFDANYLNKHHIFRGSKGNKYRISINAGYALAPVAD